MNDPILAEAKEMPEGKGARVKRAFPTSEVSKVDPFLLFDEFFVEKPAGFPMHSHSGFEVVTYMLEGAFDHEDSSGVSGRIREGEAQRMVTGGGIKHSEMPGTDGMNHGLQLWTDLPQGLKDAEPEYGKGNAGEIPVREKDGVTVRTIVGEGAPIELNTPVEYLLVEARGGSEFVGSLEEGYNGFLYLISGEAECCGGLKLDEGNVLILESNELAVEALSDVKFALAKGKPLGQS